MRKCFCSTLCCHGRFRPPPHLFIFTRSGFVCFVALWSHPSPGTHIAAVSANRSVDSSSHRRALSNHARVGLDLCSDLCSAPQAAVFSDERADVRTASLTSATNRSIFGLYTHDVNVLRNLPRERYVTWCKPTTATLLGFALRPLNPSWYNLSNETATCTCEACCQIEAAWYGSWIR